MHNLWNNAMARWSAMGTAARVWWTGGATLGLAAALVLASAIIVDATGHSAPPASASSSPPSTSAAAAGSTPTSGTTPASGGAMPGMSGGAGDSGGAGNGGETGRTGGTSGGAPASTTAAICPNVQGTTVMPDGMVMAPVPSGPPTPAEQAAANQLVSQTTASLAHFTTLSAATAAGYVPATNPDGRVVHYVNWQIVREGDVLDPARPSALVFANTVSGPVLLGAMYMGAGSCQPGPDVGGPLTQWHAHDNLCVSVTTHQVVGNTDATGTCETGTHNSSDYFMLHVWVTPSLAATHQFQADLTGSEIAPIIMTGQA